MLVRPRLRWILGAVAVVVAVIAGLTARFLIWPTQPHLQRADAIIMLGGSPSRYNEVFKLYGEGYAHVLVFSVDDPQVCPKAIAGMVTMCFRPSPFSTQGEARYIGQLARSHGWTHLIVVSSVPQMARAQLRISRCWAGQLQVVGVSPHDIVRWTYQVVYEWAALAKAELWQRAC